MLNRCFSVDCDSDRGCVFNRIFKKKYGCGFRSYNDKFSTLCKLAIIMAIAAVHCQCGNYNKIKSVITAQGSGASLGEVTQHLELIH